MLILVGVFVLGVVLGDHVKKVLKFLVKKVDELVHKIF